MLIENPQFHFESAKKLKGQVCFAIKVWAENDAGITEIPIQTRYFQINLSKSTAEKAWEEFDRFKDEFWGEYRKMELWLMEPKKQGHSITFTDYGEIYEYSR